MSANRSCLIIGAGMAGLTAAGVLQASGWEVALLDKGRGVGGRMATRQIGESRFDHGAQFFTVRDARFREAVDRWELAGWVAPWFTEGGHVRYRAAGGMNALAKHLAQPLNVRIETKVELVEPVDEGWLVITEKGENLRASTLLLTPPAHQSIVLLASCADRLPSEITSALNCVDYDPCFALLVTIDGPDRVPPPGYVRLDRGPIEWIADNTQKGVSTGTAALTIHARADFSRNHLESPKEDVARFLLEAAEPWLGGRINAWQLHRWSYSRPVAVGGPMYLFSDQPARLVIAGDAFGGPNVEGAFLSGLAAAERLEQTAN
jgi:renalase